MANVDRIRTMHISELCNFLYDVSCNTTKITTCEKECADCDKADEECKAGVTDWLLSEVEE